MKVNTNIASLNAQNYMNVNNRMLNKSLEKLSSGLRINSAADDASGMAIANSLRSQASSLGQAIKNAGDGISIVQIADKAMDEQIKILDTIKTKATQAAQDGQTYDTRKALQRDINKLMEELNNIANTTSYNGMSLLNGAFTNKQFQVGAYSNQTIGVDIGSTQADKIGHIRKETTDMITGAATDGSEAATLTFVGKGPGRTDLVMESVTFGYNQGEGVGTLSEVVNKYSDQTGVRASWSNTVTGVQTISAGGIAGLTINNVSIGDLAGIKDNDSDGKLAGAINAVKEQTGVLATVENGVLSLSSIDGRGINISSDSTDSLDALTGITDEHYSGRLTLTSLSGQDINVTDDGSLIDTSSNEATINLSSITKSFTDEEAKASGAYTNDEDIRFGTGIGVGVTSREGAMIVMDIVDSALKKLDSIRSDIGSTQNRFTSTINNATVTMVNLQAAESQIRDVDFAEETANFSKRNIMAQAASYALSQANATQQNVLRLLQ